MELLIAALFPFFLLWQLLGGYLFVLLYVILFYWLTGFADTSRRVRFGSTLLAVPVLIGLYWWFLPMPMIHVASRHWTARFGIFRYVIAEAPMAVGISVASLFIGTALYAMEVREKRRSKVTSKDPAVETRTQDHES